jgi:hypothetical protein
MTSEDFSIIREEWNRYLLLPDSIPLRLKVFLINVTVEGDKAGFEFSQFMRMPPQPEDKGTPSANQTITDQDILKKMEFERVYESLNVYDVPKIRKLVVCKPILASFSKTGVFDSKGDRVYQSFFKLAIAPIEYPPEDSEFSSESKAAGASP